ncbi:MAG: thioesterase [Pseudohongiella sp.]|nr:MAG: thioesterase [Pseudohongiella sp.]
MEESVFTAELQVRDYECDLQGIVNNAVYQHYLEHSRHEFLSSRGLDFAELTAMGVIIVVIRAELDYKQALRPGDRFSVSVAFKRLGRLKIVFEQEIHRLSDNEPVLAAKITAVSLKDGGRPYFPEQLEKLLG